MPEDKITVNRIARPTISFPKRVQKAIKSWVVYSEDMRKCRQNMLNLYQNSWFQGGGKGRTPLTLNLLDEAVGIIVPFLVSRNPRVNISSRRGTNTPNVKLFAMVLELALTHLFDEIQFGQKTLRQTVVDSLFSMGIVKTGMDLTWQVRLGQSEETVGQPYAERIDFDDYIGDVTARCRAEMKLEGHKYRLPLEYVIDSGLYKHYDLLKPGLPTYGDETSPEKTAKNDNEKGDLRELWPSVELYDIWLPDDNLIITLPPEGQGSKIMREVEADGPTGGPFDVLGYKFFPGSCVPIPPVYGWLDMNKTVNVITNKMKEQCEREKTIAVYPIDAAEDAEILKNAKHGELVGLVNSEAVKEITFGGWNEQSFPFVQFLLSRFAKTGPNLEVIGGKGVFGSTLGQEQMLQANAMHQLDDMVNQVYLFTKSIIKKLAWNLWSDPFITMPLIKRVAGKDVQLHYSQAVREGDFFDYSFEIEPYSLSAMNPEMRYQRLLQLISQVVMPLVPMAAQQGVQLDITALVKEAAKYLQINNVEDWWKQEGALDLNMNPYQPMQATPKGGGPGVSSKQSESSDIANLMQQQAKSPLKSSGEVA